MIADSPFETVPVGLTTGDELPPAPTPKNTSHNAISLPLNISLTNQTASLNAHVPPEDPDQPSVKPVQTVPVKLTGKYVNKSF